MTKVIEMTIVKKTKSKIVKFKSNIEKLLRIILRKDYKYYKIV